MLPKLEQCHIIHLGYGKPKQPNNTNYIKLLREYIITNIDIYIYIYIYTPIYIKSPKPHHVKTLLTTADESEVAHCFPLPVVMDLFAISD